MDSRLLICIPSCVARLASENPLSSFSLLRVGLVPTYLFDSALSFEWRAHGSREVGKFRLFEIELVVLTIEGKSNYYFNVASSIRSPRVTYKN